jgi:type IV pilus assembly protein PilE
MMAPASMTRDRLQGSGFTLIEMLIVLVLTAIVTSIALPTYSQYVRRARRVEARTALLQAAHRLEREATATGNYPNAALPEALAGVPSGSYRISRQPSANDADAATRFTLHATPLGGQAEDQCGTFTLSNTGERGLIGNRAKVADCWNR